MAEQGRVNPDQSERLEQGVNTDEDADSPRQKVTLPRFRGRVIPPLDRAIIMAAPPVLIVLVIVYVLFNQQGAAAIIDAGRTFVTNGFGWLFVLYSLSAVVVIIWAAASKWGTVRLGGPKARPEHGNFAWYSMLFACGQGIGLIFWSVAEPMLLVNEAPVVAATDSYGEPGIVWTYFHWGFTAWAMYCVVALCLAYSHHNLGKTLTFREATVDILPKPLQRPGGVVVELIAIMATVLGLGTSFGFAVMQFSSGVASFSGVDATSTMWLVVIIAFAALTAVSAFVGVNRGMKRISQTNSILSISLVIGVFVFGPTIYLITNMTQTFGTFFQNFLAMSFWAEAGTAETGVESWSDTWMGPWTVFIWCWVIAFSPFVGGFIARISRGRTIRQFVVGVTVVPALIVMVWTGIIGSASTRYDEQSGGAISSASAEDSSTGLFLTLDNIPVIGTLLIIVGTVLVGTYFITSLDSGTYALADFVSAPKKSGPWFRVILVVSIATVAVLLLFIGGTDAVDTVQTGTIIGGFPFSIIILLMITNFIRRLRKRSKEIRKMEKTVNDPRPLPEDELVDDDGVPMHAEAHDTTPVKSAATTDSSQPGSDPSGRTT